MGTNQTQYRRASWDMRGFSLLEMMIVLVILAVVIGVAVDGLTQMQRRNSAEGSKTDTVQETRDFVDQMVRASFITAPLNSSMRAISMAPAPFTKSGFNCCRRHRGVVHALYNAGSSTRHRPWAATSRSTSRR